METLEQPGLIGIDVEALMRAANHREFPVGPFVCRVWIDVMINDWSWRVEREDGSLVVAGSASSSPLAQSEARKAAIARLQEVVPQ